VRLRRTLSRSNASWQLGSSCSLIHTIQSPLAVFILIAGVVLAKTRFIQ